MLRVADIETYLFHVLHRLIGDRNAAISVGLQRRLTDIAGNESGSIRSRLVDLSVRSIRPALANPFGIIEAPQRSAEMRCAQGLRATPSKRHLLLLNHNTNLLAAQDKRIIAKIETALPHEFRKSLVFVLLPTRIVEIFVKHDHASSADLRTQVVKNAFGRRIKIAIDVEKRNSFVVLSHEFGQRF